MVNQKRDLIQILVFQVLTVPAVILLFKNFDRKIAAVTASCVFVGFGLFAIAKLLRWGTWRREFLFWLVALQLVFFTLPIFATRLTNWNSDFDQLSILGFTAPEFHHASQYSGIAILVVGLWRLWGVGK